MLCQNCRLAGPSDLKITVFITIQAPERFRTFWKFWNRYALFIENHKYTYFHKLNRALEIHNVLSFSQSIMIGKKTTHPDYLNYIYFHKLNRASDILGIQYFFQTYQRHYEKNDAVKNACISQIALKSMKYQHVDLPQSVLKMTLFCISLKKQSH